MAFRGIRLTLWLQLEGVLGSNVSRKGRSIKGSVVVLLLLLSGWNCRTTDQHAYLSHRDQTTGPAFRRPYRYTFFFNNLEFHGSGPCLALHPTTMTSVLRPWIIIRNGICVETLLKYPLTHVPCR